MKKLSTVVLALALAASLGSVNTYGAESITKDNNQLDTAIETSMERAGTVVTDTKDTGDSEQNDDPGYIKYIRQQSVRYERSMDSSSEGYIHNSKFADATVHYGIDVSRYQGDIDWTAVKNSGVEYVFVRVAYRGYGTTGSLNTDSKAQDNLNGAKEAGLKVGAYMLSQAITVEEAREEAAFAMEQVNGHNLDMPLVIDYEYVTTEGRLYQAGLSREEKTAIVNAYCETVKAEGYAPMVYADKSMLQDGMNAGDIKYSIWLANYTTQTTYAGDYEFWQYRDDGSVDGISTSVDCNFWYELPEVKNGWEYVDGKAYWYENGVKQGLEGRGKEIYDPESDAWYWLDSIQDGAKATSKDVYMPYTINGQDTIGKWVRYDEDGHMIKGEDYRYGGWYWLDPITGAMTKGFVNISDGTAEGKWVYYDEITGQMHHGESCINGNWYYFDDWTGKMVHGESYVDGNWYYYDDITGIRL